MNNHKLVKSSNPAYAAHEAIGEIIGERVNFVSHYTHTELLTLVRKLMEWHVVLSVEETNVIGLEDAKEHLISLCVDSESEQRRKESAAMYNLAEHVGFDFQNGHWYAEPEDLEKSHPGLPRALYDLFTAGEG